MNIVLLVLFLVSVLVIFVFCLLLGNSKYSYRILECHIDNLKQDNDSLGVMYGNAKGEMCELKNEVKVLRAQIRKIEKICKDPDFADFASHHAVATCFNPHKAQEGRVEVDQFSIE